MSRGITLSEAYRTVGARELNTLYADWHINGPFDGSRVDYLSAQQTAATIATSAKDPKSIKPNDFLIWRDQPTVEDREAKMKATLDALMMRQAQNGQTTTRPR